MAKRIPTELVQVASGAFPNLKPVSARAPQGQNKFCFNVRLEDSQGKQFLLKAIRTRSTSVDAAAALDEVRALQAVRSQYVVPLIDVKSASGYALLLFPFLDGKNLAEYAKGKGGTLTEDEIKDIGIGLLRGVSDLTRHRIRHQDIKPENIFVTTDGGIKILDFGSARFRKTTFKGSTKTNRSHSSPEQILASKPVNLEALRLTCDERSDVYSVGSVLYELATGQLPFRSNEEKLKGIPPRPIGVPISDGMKRVLNRFLNHHPRNRPTASQATAFIEASDVQPTPVERGGFLYNSGNSLKRLLEVHADDDTLYSGVIVDASKFPNSDQAYLRNGSLMAIVDPQTYLFQAPKLINAKFRKLPYYKFAKSGADVGIEQIKDTRGFIESVFDYEISAGADRLVSPFFLVREFNDLSWQFDAEVTNQSLRIYRERGLQLPLLKGVAVAENVLVHSVTRGRLIDHLTNTDWLPDIAGFFVLLENSGRNGYPNEEWLAAASELLKSLLSTGKVVIWSHAYLPAITFSHSGIGLGMGEGQSQKSFSLNEDTPETQRTTPHQYVPRIFARIKWPSGIRALSTHHAGRLQDFVCTDECCKHVDFSNPSTRDKKDLALHSIRQLGLQFKKYSGSGGATREREDIATAQEIYNAFKTHPDKLARIAMQNELKPDTGTFLDSALKAFHNG